MAQETGILARGPWAPEAIQVRWRAQPYEPSPETTAAADDALQKLRDRDSPSHDGLAARLRGYETDGDGLRLDCEPVRWALRLLPGGSAESLSALCLVRASDGRWLAGRRSSWLATWPGRWGLGAAGAVEVDENPARTLVRELGEEWSVTPQRLTVEALVRTPTDMTMLVGQAWLAAGTSVTPDPEHDAHEWWPADPDDWPDYADEPLRLIAALVG